MYREYVMKEPEPMVLIHNFSNASVDFSILFRVADLTKWLELKSRLMSDIYETFYKEGIEIAFQQKDIKLQLTEANLASLSAKDAIITKQATN